MGLKIKNHGNHGNFQLSVEGVREVSLKRHYGTASVWVVQANLV